MQENTNPLSSYFRQVKLSTPIPTRGKFYPEGFLKQTMTGELEIYGLNALDELNFKNPDLLVNGQAMINAIKSCVPGVSNPAKLFLPDVNALMVAIRMASSGEDFEIDLTCPECKKNNDEDENKSKGKKKNTIVEPFTFNLSLRNLLDTMSFHDDEYVYSMKNGPKVYITPFKYDIYNKTNMFEFEFQKIIQYAKDATITEEDKLKKISKPIEKMTQVHLEMISDSVSKIIVGNSTVDNRKHIDEFIRNIDKSDVENIKKIIEKVNKIGIKSTFKCTCPVCNHSWDNEQIPFDPTYFFG